IPLCPKINDLNSLEKLQILVAPDCDITNDGLNGLVNLVRLCIDDNKKVTNVNHMKKLQILQVAGKCGVGNSGINQLTQLCELYMGDNPNITYIGNLVNLTVLHAQAGCKIDDKSIRHL